MPHMFKLDACLRLRAMLDSVPAMLGYWDKSLHNQFANQAYATWFGVEPQKLLGLHIRDVIGEERFQLNLPYIAAALRGEHQVFERAIPDPHSHRVRQSLAEYIPDVVAGEVQGFFVQVSDITQVKETYAALQASEAKLRGLFELSPLGIGLCDMNGRFLQVNPAFCEICGYTEAELLQTDFWALTPPVHSAQEAEHFAALRRTGRYGPYEKDYRHKAGHLVRVQLNGLLIDGPDGEPLIWSIVEDVRERRAALVELTLAKESAQTANLTKSRFLATMSHEIRTPLNGILGMAQLLLLPGIGEHERLDYARTILRSGQSLLTLLNDILDLSRVESGGLTLESTALRPLALISEIQALFSAQAKSAGLALEAHWTGAAQATYLGDPHRLHQMLANLVNNAIKFTPQGHVRVTARELGHSAHGVMLEFAVSDTGVGIAPDKQHLLFQSFSQTDASTTRRYGGSGLGLSIVRNLAELMGGTVGVHSEPGRGSRVWFQVQLGHVPADDCGIERASTRDAPLPDAEWQAPQFCGHVLVAEDNPTNQGVIQALLHKHGLHVTLAADGQQALNAVTQGQAGRPLDLVLMDLQMPVMDGCSATRHIRAWEARSGRPHLPVVALSAGAFEDDREPALASGMDAFLTKPIVLAQLQATLVRWLARSADTGASSLKLKPVDVARVRALIDQVMPLLADNSFAAIGYMRQLQDALAGTALADQMNQTAGQLQEFRFDLVQQRLCQMMAQQQWESMWGCVPARMTLP